MQRFLSWVPVFTLAVSAAATPAVAIDPASTAVPVSPIAERVAAAPLKSSSKVKVAKFLEQVGGTYTKVSEGVWQIPHNGKSLANFDVLVITVPDSDLLAIFATVVEKKNLKISQNLLYKLLRFNNAADRAKVGFDDDDDLFVRIDLDSRTVDLKEFQEALGQVAAVSDEVYAAIKGSIVQP